MVLEAVFTKRNFPLIYVYNKLFMHVPAMSVVQTPSNHLQQRWEDFMDNNESPLKRIDLSFSCSAVTAISQDD